MPDCPLSSHAKIPFFGYVRKYISRNRVVNGNLVHSKIVPLINEVW